MINEDFQKVLDEYLQARKENGYTSAPIAHHIQQTLKNEIADIVDNPDYKITAIPFGALHSNRSHYRDWRHFKLIFSFFGARDVAGDYGHRPFS